MKKLIPLAALLMLTACLSACKKVDTKYDEWCIGGVTYYHFDKGDEPYAVAPKYDTEHKVVTCDSQTATTE